MHPGVAWIATGVCAAAVAALLVAERRGLDRARRAAKLVASLAFVAVAAALANGADDRPARLVLVGLALGAGGDLALTLPGRRALAAGTALFLAGHLAYAAAALDLTSPASWTSHGVIGGAVALGVAGALVRRWLWPHLDARAPVPRSLVLAYLLVALAMALAAVVPAIDLAATTRARRLAAGALLFLASDLAVARQRFVRPSFTNKAWGLPTYFLAQLLIAWSTEISAS
jgi:uncharacterized membrane protein YhhN